MDNERKCVGELSLVFLDLWRRVPVAGTLN